ncbi:hypothetical protein CCAN12_770082 [Capnocytophaga canimorsus]|uniref:Uncharacterized protein n=1 Tax=Capnocytophaga canimorsus TaxID=28188 RepID=A0A0B7HPN6_9FLAO|nr:hypothetical protein CCAN12_770082 [Capnocytophaga canimorsus]
MEVTTYIPQVQEVQKAMLRIKSVINTTPLSKKCAIKQFIRSGNLF